MENNTHPLSIETLGRPKPKTHLLGIDPGVTGALAVYDPVTHTVIDVQDMPVHEIRGKKRIDLYGLAFLIDGYSKYLLHTVIEEVGVMTGKEGTVSMFNFGFSYGAVCGAVTGNYVPLTTVKPAVWKGALGLSSDKDLSRKKASHLFPKESHRWSRKKDNGRAEALLLAVFGARYVVRIGVPR